MIHFITARFISRVDRLERAASEFQQRGGKTASSAHAYLRIMGDRAPPVHAHKFAPPLQWNGGTKSTFH